MIVLSTTVVWTDWQRCVCSTLTRIKPLLSGVPSKRNAALKTGDPTGLLSMPERKGTSFILIVSVTGKQATDRITIKLAKMYEKMLRTMPPAIPALSLGKIKGGLNRAPQSPAAFPKQTGKSPPAGSAAECGALFLSLLPLSPSRLISPASPACTGRAREKRFQAHNQYRSTTANRQGNRCDSVDIGDNPSTKGPLLDQTKDLLLQAFLA